MTSLAARAIVRFRHLVIAGWVALAALAVPRAARVADVLSVDVGSVKTESERAYQLVREAFPRPIAHFFAITIQGPMPIDSAPFGALLDSLAASVRREPAIARVVSYHDTRDASLVSRDRRTTFFIAALGSEESRTATSHTPVVRRAVDAAVASLPQARDFEIHVTGAPALDYDVRTVSLADTRRGEQRSLPLAAVVLVLAFGALVAALLPLVVGVIAITCSFALVYLAAAFHPMSVFVLNIVSMIGLGVGIDYSLLMVTRFREELNRGLGSRDAATRTIATAGQAVITSGLTVVVGFAALLTIPVPETRSIALGGLLVVAVAVLLSVTLLPAGLAVLGRAIDGPHWLAHLLAWYHHPLFWEPWARWLGYHPIRALAIGGVIAAAITWPLAKIRIGLPSTGWFPSGTDAENGARALEAIGSRGVIEPIRIVLQAPPGSRIVGSRFVRGLSRLSDSIQTDPRVARVRSVVDLESGTSSLQYAFLYSDPARARAKYGDFLSAYLSEDNRTTLLDVVLTDTTSLTDAMDVVRWIRAVANGGVRGLDSVQVSVGGFVASGVDLQDDLLGRFPLLIGLIVVSTAIMLALAYRSVLVPLKAVAMNCLSVAGAFGLIVLVFQRGVGGHVFGLRGPTEAIYVVVPVLVFAVVFGLSMDYGVFLLSRIKEAFDRTGRNDQATMEGLSATASTITSAAAIMIIVFGTFSFARMLVVQLIGFGLAVAVFLDATLIRMVLAPAIMHIAGRWNWWPGVTPDAAPRAGTGRPRQEEPGEAPGGTASSTASAR
ncbi:MAG: MMPL family transporter [Gemmatimonadetes bacterium]|nr:MMPL family transporter [Gemmatimonadota bacterium]